MSQCNYCSYEQLRIEAKRNGMITTKIVGFIGGIDVYVHPKDVDIHILSTVKRKLYFRQWYMKLGNKCEC